MSLTSSLDILRAFNLQSGLDPATPLSGVACAHGVRAEPKGELLQRRCPSTGEFLPAVRGGSVEDLASVTKDAVKAFAKWRSVPAPQRGEIVRLMGEKLRARKEELGALVSLEVGKIRSEGLGEVQEMIDMADFAVGLSRQLHGLTMHSERPEHRMLEQWHPIGPVAVISAFNFPVAVWAWNAFLAMVCGDTVVWKPSEKAPLTSLAVSALCQEVLEATGHLGVLGLVNGGREIGAAMAADPRYPLISATGSCRMGRDVGEVVARRFGRTLLELGGNNAIIVLDDADLDLATRAIAFGAVGTAGQRCTTTRRVLAGRGIAPKLIERLRKAYASVPIGDPLAEGTLLGPLIDEQAVAIYSKVIERVKAEGGEILHGGKVLERPGFFVEPALVRAPKGMPLMKEENFVPVLYVVEIDSLEEAMAIHNDVPQGLSSAIFTDSLRSAERFLSAGGSDCGIANVNIGTSGAEIGGAFGGEKETGGGRESGSDAWKSYMRRQTCTINWGSTLPLAQGVKFDIA